MDDRKTSSSNQAPFKGSGKIRVYYSFSRKLKREWFLTFGTKQAASPELTLNENLGREGLPVGQALTELLHFDLAEYQHILNHLDVKKDKPSAATRNKLLASCFHNGMEPSKQTLELLGAFDLRDDSADNEGNSEDPVFERSCRLIRDSVRLPKRLQTPRFFHNSLIKNGLDGQATYSFVHLNCGDMHTEFLPRYVALYESALHLLNDAVKQGNAPSPSSNHPNSKEGLEEWFYPQLLNLVLLLISNEDDRNERIDLLQSSFEKYVSQIKKHMEQDSTISNAAQRDANRTLEFVAEVTQINKRNLALYRNVKKLNDTTLYEDAALDASNILMSSFAVAPTATGLGELVAAMAYACFASNTTLKSCPACGTPFALVAANNKTYCCDTCREQSNAAAPGRKQVSAVYQAIRRKTHNRHGGKKDQTGYFETLGELLNVNSQSKPLGKLYRDNSFIPTPLFNEWCNAIKSVKQWHLQKSGGLVYCEYDGVRINPPIPIIWNGRLYNVSVPCKVKGRKGEEWANLISLLKRNANVWRGDSDEPCENLAGYTVSPLRWLNPSIGGSQSPLETQLRLDPEKSAFAGE